MSGLAVRKPIGLYVGDREVTASRVALTPLGPVALETRSEPYEAEQLPEVLGRLLGPWLGPRRPARVRVALGLPAMRVFFSTRPIQVTDRNASPTVLLHEVLRSSNVNVDEMEVDLVKRQPGKRPLASLISCKRKYIAGLLEALRENGVRPFRAEPAPFALLRLGALRHRGPRKASVVVRVFLGPAQGAAVLLKGPMPLAWRTFELPAGGEAAAVLSTALALQVVGRHCGEDGPPDAVILHGRTDLAESFRAEVFTAALGTRPAHAAEPSYDSRSIAEGLALGCQEGEEALDLARTLKSRAPLWEVIPWGALAAQAGILAGLTLMLDGHSRDTRRAYHLVRAEGAGHAWAAKVGDDALETEKKDLEQKITAARDFLETRVLWTSYTRDAASRLTENMALRSFIGLNEFAGPAGGGSKKKSLVLAVSSPIPRGEGMPREIEDYLDALRGDATLRRDFPQVELADLKWSESGAGPAVSSAQATFTVQCLPKAPEKKGPRPAANLK
jgi:hypothetical protein